MGSREQERRVLSWAPGFDGFRYVLKVIFLFPYYCLGLPLAGANARVWWLAVSAEGLEVGVDREWGGTGTTAAAPNLAFSALFVLFVRMCVPSRAAATRHCLVLYLCLRSHVD